MRFELLTNLQPGVFFSLELNGKSQYFLLPTRTIPEGDDYFVRDFAEAEGVKTNFTVGLVGHGNYVDAAIDGVGFLFHSTLPVINFGTAILSYSRAWQRNHTEGYDIVSNTSVVFKTDQFFIYNTPSIATLVTCPDLSDQMSSYLTMI